MKILYKFLFILAAFALVAVNGYTQNPVLNSTMVNPAAISPTSTSSQSNDQSLQLDNHLPLTKLPLKPSQNLEDNRIGGNAETRHVDSRVWNTGYKWMRVIIDPLGKWQHADWGKNEYAINPDEEKIIDELVSHKIKILLVLDVWYTENRTINYKTDKDISTYTNWVRYVVNHFKGRIDYYEILNEPNLDINAPSGMPVTAYANLVKKVVPVIKGEDPGAKIVVGGVPDTRFNDAREWISGLLKSGVMPLVDGLSWHAMYGAAPSNDQRGVRQTEQPQMKNYWENYPAYVAEIKSVAASNGFKGEFLTEEMLWRTPSMPHETEPDTFTDVSAAKYCARAIIIHLGLNVAPGLALVPDDAMPRSYATLRALSTIMSGAQPTAMRVNIEGKASNFKYYGFDLSNSDKLLVIWIDDIAVENDAGVSTAITLPGSSAESVSGIDVLNGFEQKLITGMEKGNLVIRNLLVKDYPIILRFVKPHFSESSTVEPSKVPVIPVTIKLKNGEERIPARTPIQLSTGWATDKKEQLADFLAAVNMSGTLDGKSLSNLTSFWGEIEPYKGGTAGNYISHWLLPLGVLNPGDHSVEIRCTLSRPVTDGYDMNKDGKLDEYSGEIWHITLHIKVH